MKLNKISTIGVVHSKYKTPEDAPYQGVRKDTSEIEILQEYAVGLKNIESFSHLHIFYLLHKKEDFSLSVTTPWSTQKRGLFATRSPNRPTPLGYAVVELLEVKNNVLKVRGLDAIDGTPVVDIKPYIPSLDAKPLANDGWLGKRKLSFTPRVYEYEIETEWKEAKEGVLQSDKKPDVRIGCPPEFGGEPVYWSPEHLLVASVDVCIMTTFLDLVKKETISLLSYSSKATGKAQLVDGIFKFKTIEITPDITISRKEDVLMIRKLINQSAEKCMVSNTLNIKVMMKPKIKGGKQ